MDKRQNPVWFHVLLAAPLFFTRAYRASEMLDGNAYVVCSGYQRLLLGCITPRINCLEFGSWKQSASRLSLLILGLVGSAATSYGAIGLRW